MPNILQLGGFVFGAIAGLVLLVATQKGQEPEPEPKKPQRRTIVINGTVSGDIYDRLFSDFQKASRDEASIDLVLNTNGGNSLTCQYLCSILVNYRFPITVWIPYLAQSGGTMLALCAMAHPESRIVMGEFAFMTKCDTLTGDDNISYRPQVLWKARERSMGTAVEIGRAHV